MSNKSRKKNPGVFNYEASYQKQIRWRKCQDIGLAYLNAPIPEIAIDYILAIHKDEKKLEKIINFLETLI